MRITKTILPIAFVIAFVFLAGACRKSEPVDLFGRSAESGRMDEVTLTVYFVGQESTTWDEIAAEIEDRTRKSLNINLDLHFIPPYQYADIMQDLLQRGGTCDIFTSATSQEFLDAVCEAGYAMDITELLPRYAPGYYGKLDIGLLGHFMREGKLIAVPNYLLYVNRPCAIVREDLLNKYGMQTIGGIDDFERFMRNVKDNEPKTWVLAIDSESQSIVNIFANAYGYVILDQRLGLVYKWDDPEMKVTAWEDMPEYKSFVERVYGWYRSGYALENSAFIRMSTFYNTSYWAAWIGNQLSAISFNSALYAKNSEYRYLEFPLFPEARAQRVPYVLDGFIINAQSKNPERALMFIDWIHASQKNYDLMRLGIEGKHYRLKGDQINLDEKTNMSMIDVNQTNLPFFDIDYERTTIANSKNYRDDVVRTYKNFSVEPPHSGFRVDTSGINYIGRYIELYRIESEIVQGRYTSETIEEYRKTQKNAGIDATVAEVQRQLDDWRTKKNED